MTFISPVHYPKVFQYLYDAAARLEAGLEGITSATLTFGTKGVILTMFREMPSGRVANAAHTITWKEIVLSKYDLLDALIADMHEKVVAHTEEETINAGK